MSNLMDCLEGEELHPKTVKIFKKFTEELSGSGVDCDWRYEIYQERRTIHLYNSYHCMNKNGMYVCRLC